MKRSYLALLLVLLLPVSLYAASPKSIRITDWKLPFNMHVIMAKSEKIYEKSFPGTSIDWLKLASGPKQLEAIAAGELDIAVGVGDSAALIALANGLDAKIIGVNSVSPGAFAVVTNNPSVKKIVDLKGKKVVGLRGSVVYQVFLAALSESGLSEKDVEFFPMPVAQAAATLLSKRADAALLVGPEIIRLKKSGGRVLADGRGRVAGISLILARSGFVDKYPEAVLKFIEATAKADALIVSDRAKSVKLAAKETMMSEADADESFGMYSFDVKITPQVMKELEKTAALLYKQKFIKKMPDAASFIWSGVFKN